MRTVRAYCYALLTWHRVLWFVGVDWERATESDTAAMVGWLRIARNPQRRRGAGALLAGSVNVTTGKPVLGAGYQPSTINLTLAAVHGFYAFHAHWGRGPVVNPVPGSPQRRRALMHRSPLEPTPSFRRARLRQKSVATSPRSIPQPQWEALFAAMGCDRDRALLAAFVSSGVRAAEMLGMAVEDVDWAGQRAWVVSKGSRERRMAPLSPEAMTWLARYLDADGVPAAGEPLWRTRRGTQRALSYTALRRVMQRANAGLDTNWTVHDLRHTAAARMVSAGRDPRFGARLVWEVLARMGHFPAGTPDTLRLALVGGRRDVTAMVDRYPVRNREVRQLLVDYLSHRAVDGIDYTSVDGLARDLVRNFWLVIESINPGQADLDLDEATYQAWLARVSVVDGPGGPQPRSSLFQLLMRVRAFYLDLQSWASASPQLWARWVARCPIPASATHSYNRSRLRQMDRISDRTRLRQPLLPLLVEHVTTRWEHYRRLLEHAEAATPGEVFRFAGVDYTRIVISTDAQGRRALRGLSPLSTVVIDHRSGAIVQVAVAAERAFWIWAAVEMLRLTGIRHEELLELTHLSIRQFQRPNGEVVALLVIAPSKTDRERVIPMSAQLFHVVAALVRHQTAGGRPVPLVRRWDPLERRHSPLLPFLFQHRSGASRSVFSTSWALGALRRACDEIAITHPQFAGTSFTPHDFRRIFATDLVNNGLPIHIGAALLGHTNLQTTRGYVAVFDEDVVRHYQQHLLRRRDLRPAEEYRETTEQEWAEFEAHFDKRKVELGGCARPYGTPCAHEHACIRCPMLQINPAMLPRLDELETDLITRRARAESEGWLGELEGLDLTLTFLRDKRVEARRLAPLSSTDLGMPGTRRSPDPAGA